MMISRKLLIVLLTLILGIPALAQSIESLENARVAYEQNDFENAIQFFELTVDGGIYNGGIFYNLGNSHYQQGNIAQALLNYRRSLQTLPRDLDLNIQLARTRSIRTVPQSETTHPLILMEQVTENTVTIQELSIITFIVWTAFWILIGLYQLRERWRGALRLLIGSVLILLVCTGALLGSRLYIQNNMPPAVVITGSAPIYSGPSVSYFRQYDLFAASEIYIVEEQDEWRRFVTPDNRQGWIEATAIEVVPIK